MYFTSKSVGSVQSYSEKAQLPPRQNETKIDFMSLDLVGLKWEYIMNKGPSFVETLRFSVINRLFCTSFLIDVFNLWASVNYYVFLIKISTSTKIYDMKFGNCQINCIKHKAMVPIFCTYVGITFLYKIMILV